MRSDSAWKACFALAAGARFLQCELWEERTRANSTGTRAPYGGDASCPAVQTSFRRWGRRPGSKPDHTVAAATPLSP